MRHDGSSISGVVGNAGCMTGAKASTVGATGTNVSVLLGVGVGVGSDPVKNEQREDGHIEERSAAQREFESSVHTGSKNADGTKSDTGQSEANFSESAGTAQYAGAESVYVVQSVVGYCFTESPSAHGVRYDEPATSGAEAERYGSAVAELSRPSAEGDADAEHEGDDDDDEHVGGAGLKTSGDVNGEIGSVGSNGVAVNSASGATNSNPVVSTTASATEPSTNTTMGRAVLDDYAGTSNTNSNIDTNGNSNTGNNDNDTVGVPADGSSMLGVTATRTTQFDTQTDDYDEAATGNGGGAGMSEYDTNEANSVRNVNIEDDGDEDGDVESLLSKEGCHLNDSNAATNGIIVKNKERKNNVGEKRKRSTDGDSSSGTNHEPSKHVRVKEQDGVEQTGELDTSGTANGHRNVGEIEGNDLKRIRYLKQDGNPCLTGDEIPR